MRPRKRLIPMFAVAGVLLTVDAAFACTTPQKFAIIQMKSDLRNLVEVQDEFLKKHGRYAASVRELGPNWAGTSTGVTLVIGRARRDGYTAITNHAGYMTVCRLFVGPRPYERFAPDGTERESTCDDADPPPAGHHEPDVTISMLLWVLVLAMALAARVFLKFTRRGRWGGWTLVAVGLVVYPIALTPMSSYCGPPNVEAGGVFASLSALLFWFMLRGEAGTPNVAPPPSEA